MPDPYQPAMNLVSFGYENVTGFSLSGANQTVTIDGFGVTPDPGAPTEFLPGLHGGGFWIGCSPASTVTWTLLGHSATTFGNSPVCGGPQGPKGDDGAPGKD